MAPTLPTTSHRIIVGDSRDLSALAKESIDLIVTSPPYPMIEMWDDLFRAAAPEIDVEKDPLGAHEVMHRTLDPVWRSAFRLLCPGGILCINIGDAARSIGAVFRLFSNHTRILASCLELGFQALPLILWRKQTNAPTKFMGSGMFAPGAYVTLEHEYILVLRKGGKREFGNEPLRDLRRRSAYFWEERNLWFSDLWEIKGARQSRTVPGSRSRSASFPFELAFRLVSMFSIQGDLVFDPFAGTATTMAAAAAAGRNSLGIEIDPALAREGRAALVSGGAEMNDYLERRLERHRVFVEKRRAVGQAPKYSNEHHGFPVVTAQERWLRIDLIDRIEEKEEGAAVSYRTVPSPSAVQLEFEHVTKWDSAPGR